ncbi:MAG: hypothetical protein RL062_297 [Bacteroidota bacterium]|jgi:hypothetical protein
MRAFVIKVSVFGMIAILCHFAAGYFMNGHTDSNYLRFLKHPNKGMIIGTSRTAQEICPDDLNLHPGLFNAGFSMMTSPYGEAYTAYIFRQLDTTRKDQTFVLCVDPWSLSSLFDTIGGTEIWTENDKMVAQTRSLMSPNWEYLIEQYAYGWGNIVLEHYRPTQGMVLHDNGWLEVQRQYDPVKAKVRQGGKLENYKKDVGSGRRPSPARWEALKNLIHQLQPLGKVMLIRIPCSPEFRAFEQQFWMDFDQRMLDLGKEEKVRYWNPEELNSVLPFNDGHHMNYVGAHQFSKLLDVELGR